MTKTAIILFNLGGPDKAEAVKPFLFNLFNDKAILRLPQPFRYLLAKLISSRRATIAEAIYAKIGGGSPILPNTEQQARALEQALSDTMEAKCFIAMRCWHPFVEQAAREVQAFKPERIILLPLYPQYSTTTAASSLKSWRDLARKLKMTAPTTTLCCYPDEPGFIETLAELTKAAYAKAQEYGTPRILFSAHGLPEKIIRDGDPYQWQCEQTVKALRQAIALPDMDSVLCYQSRVGPMRWIGPATDAEILRAGEDKKPLVVVPIAFVSEHSETLVEIDMEYRHLATSNGVPFFVYTGTASTAPLFINGLADLVRKAISHNGTCIAGDKTCPPNFTGCCQKG